MTDQNHISSEKQISPYVGPRPFLADDESKGRKLYGRTRETRRLLDLLIAERLIMLYSPSGAGKTSLLNAALIPRLRHRRFEVLPLMRVNQEPPQGFTLPPETNPYIFSLLLYLEEPLPAETQLPLETLVGLSLAGYLEQRQANLAGLSLAEYQTRLKDETVKPKSLVLIFDQFEEILTIDPTNQPAREAFFEQVGEALRNRWVWAVFSLREDYVAGLDAFLRYIPTRLSTTFRLELLQKTAARQAIQGPANAFDKNFTDEAADQLFNSLSQIRVAQRDGTIVEKPGLDVEPVQLQVVCRRIWDSLSPETTEISNEHITAYGNVDNALSDYYDDKITAVAEKHQVRVRHIRDWFDQRLITGQGVRGQVLRTFDAAEQGLEDEVIDDLVNTYLVRSEERRGAIWLELAHDRLIQPVQRSNADWREDNLSTLQRQAALWKQQNRPEGLLLSGDTLEDAERWAQAHADMMTTAEQDFLAQSQKAREDAKFRLQAAENAARAEETAKSAAKLRQRAVWIGVFAIVATGLAIIAGVFASLANNNLIAANNNLIEAQDNEQTAVAENLKYLENERYFPVTLVAARSEVQVTVVAANTAAAELRQTAEAAATAAIDFQRLADAAGTAASEQRSTAEVARMAASVQQEIAVSERNLAGTAAAERDNAIAQLQKKLETVAAQSDQSAAERATAEKQLADVVAAQTAVALAATKASQAAIAATETVLALPTSTPTSRPTSTPTPIPTFTPTPVSFGCVNPPVGEFQAVWDKYNDRLGCPKQVEPVIYGNFAEQYFESGYMFWGERPDDLVIVLTYGDNPTWYELRAWSFVSNGATCASKISPGPGQYLPINAFGGVWCDNPGIRQTLGFAIEPERGMGGAVQEFDGGFIFRNDDQSRIYVLFRDDGSYIPKVEEVRIIDGQDDAEERIADNITEWGSHDLEMVYDTDFDRGQQIVGVRFPNLEIPKNSTIVRAYIEFVTHYNKTNGAPSTPLTIYGEAIDNAPDFGTFNNISTRAKTGTSFLWNVPAWNDSGVLHRSQDFSKTPSDLTRIVQDVVSRAGWKPGNAVVFIIEGPGDENNFKNATSFEGSEDARINNIQNWNNYKPPLLHIEYMPPD